MSTIKVRWPAPPDYIFTESTLVNGEDIDFTVEEDERVIAHGRVVGFEVMEEGHAIELEVEVR